MPPLSNRSPEDGSKNGVQAGCGALFGLIVPFGGTFIGYSVQRSGILTIVLVCLGSAAFFGFVAYQLGARFWERVRWWV